MGNGFDVIIAGLGAMGSAAAYHLTSDGKRILGLDRFRPPHELGSSHGRTRIIREAYFEHPVYVPLVRRAYDLWADLERKSGQRLLLPTGGLMIGPADGTLVSGARKSAEDYGLPHEVLSAAELRARFPVFNPTQELVAVAEPRAGILYPELAIQTHLELAAKAGATLRFDEPILNWSPDGDGVRITTGKASHRAGRLLLSAGAWTSSLTADFNFPLTVERQVLCWFEAVATPDRFGPARCPIFIWEYALGRCFYGFPDLGDGVKAAIHHEGQETQPDLLRRDVQTEDIQRVRALLTRFVPGAAGQPRSAAVCMYTNTPDGHFILGLHPAWPQVVIASPCSGHGFKFAPVIGEMAATLLDDRRPPFDLSLFRPERFAAGPYPA